MSWTEQAFDRWYLVVYPHRDDAEARRAVALLGGQTSLSGRRVLDMGCGPGRHLECLCELGARGVGLDRSTALLSAARRRFTKGASVALVRADLAAPPFASRAFDGVTSFFTTFGYDTEERDQLMLHEAARVLVGGGFLLLDVLNRDVVLASEAPAETRRSSGDVRIFERRRFDDGGRRVVKRVTIEPAEGGAPLADYEERVTLYEADELREMVAAAGLVVRREWGSYEGAPFDSKTSARHVLFASKEAA